jgi:tetratricopeptide (TPR) repeat protein
MYLKLADRLVKQGDYAGALQAIAKAREVEPGNRYAIAYEERVRHLLQESENQGPFSLLPGTLPPASGASTGILEDFPTAEKQIRKIATFLPKAPVKPPPPDSKNIAILSKVASLLSSANHYLTQQRFSLALETVARATLLDPKNKDIRTIEERIRATQDEERRRAGRLMEERALEEKRERDRALQQELERLKFERECKRQDEENQRRNAQEQKIAQSLRRANDFLKAGQLDEAQCEFAFVSVLAPGAAEVLTLEAELTRSREDRDRVEQEAYRRHREEERLREQELREEVDRCIREAEVFASQELFNDALRVLTDAYLRDPNNRDVEACENRILSARKASEESRETLRHRQEEEARKQAKEAEARRHQEEWATLRHAVLQQEEDQKRKTETAISNHLRAARMYLEGDRLKEALAEVALAFVLNPLHPDVKAIEREINVLKPPPAPARSPSTPVLLSPEVEADLEAIAKHIAGAKHLMTERRFAAALHEVNQALTLDPENVAAKRLASRIRKEQKKESEQQRDESPRGSGSSSRRELRSEHVTPATLHPATLALGDFLEPFPSLPLPAPVGAGETLGSGGVRKHWLKKLLDVLGGTQNGPGAPLNQASTQTNPPLFSRPNSDLDSLRGGVSY